MTFLPIVERELRVAARRRGTYWSRTVIALVVVGIGMWIYLMARHESPAEVSIGMFIGLTIVTGLFCLFAGVQTTSDCLSEEKRDGTLGLLFLTDLRGYDVVAGKLVAGSLNTFYGLLATLPMLAIPLLMGGVTGGEFWRVTLVLVNTLFFSLACGMFASVLSKAARSGVAMCLLLVIFFSGLLPLTAVIIAASTDLVRDPLELAFLFAPSPGYGFTLAFEQNYKGGHESFWMSLIAVHCLAWAFLGLTCFLLPRSWQDKAATVSQLRWRDRWLRWSLGNSAERADFRTRLLDVNAFYWLASRSRIKPAMVWALLGALACCWIWGWVKIGRDWLNPGVYITTALLLNTLLKCWFSAETVAQLAEDRRIGALELLLSTPLEVFDITRGQFLALCRQFARPILFVVALEFAFMITAIASKEIGSGEGSWVLIWLGGLAVLVADIWALFYVGMWQALTSRSSNRANTAALARILALPWILYAAFLMVVALSAIAWRSGPNVSEIFFIGAWIVISLAADLFFGLRAKSFLETRFREVATARYAPGRSLWSFIFGGPKTPGGA
jgi:ABC-type transport system involved in cytochrome c biogenesis permease component